MSPELIDPQKFGLNASRPTKSSDCYSLGMVIYETISGNRPFYRDLALTALARVLEGKHPDRGVGFTDDLWRVLEQCWMPQPSERPSVESVLLCLNMCSNSLVPPQQLAVATPRMLQSPTPEGAPPRLERISGTATLIGLTGTLRPGSHVL